MSRPSKKPGIKSLTPEEKILCLFAREVFLDRHCRKAHSLCEKEEVRWHAVYSIAEQHGVAPLIYENLKKCAAIKHKISQRYWDQFSRCSSRSLLIKDFRENKLEEILSFFNNKSIDVMLIKGAALDILVYDQPGSTVSNDIDIVLGMKKEALPEKDRNEIWEFVRTIPWLECDWFDHHDVSMNNILPIDFNNFWNHAGKIQFKGREAYVMSPEDTLIALCINSCRKKYFRLKAMCDIVQTIHKYKDIKWYAVVRDARAYGCSNMVYTAILAADMMLGCDVPDEVMNSLITGRVREKIIRWLVRHKSFSSLSSLFGGKRIFGRKAGCSLILPYATYSWRQILAHLRLRIPYVATIGYRELRK